MGGHGAPMGVRVCCFSPSAFQNRPFQPPSAFQNPHQKSEPSNVAKKCQTEPNRIPKSQLKSMKMLPGPPPKAGADKDACIGRPKSRHLRFYVHENTISTGSKVSRNAPEMLPKCTFKCTKRSKNGFQKRSTNPSHT
jgi:hypothetical protein